MSSLTVLVSASRNEIIFVDDNDDTQLYDQLIEKGARPVKIFTINTQAREEIEPLFDHVDIINHPAATLQEIKIKKEVLSSESPVKKKKKESSTSSSEPIRVKNKTRKSVTRRKVRDETSSSTSEEPTPKKKQTIRRRKVVESSSDYTDLDNPIGRRMGLSSESEEPARKKKQRMKRRKDDSSSESEKPRSRKSKPAKDDIDVVIYSERSVAVVGEGTREIKDELKEIGGKFNGNLTVDGKRKAGWIFGNTKQKQVEKLVGMKARKMKK